MKVKLSNLRVSEFSKSIYLHVPTSDLIVSIKNLGVLVPIWITKDNIIISGHRRVNACKELGIDEIEAEIKEYSDLLVLESNRYRKKTWSEKLREVEAIEKIYKEKAKEKQHESGGAVPQKSDKPPIDTLKEMAKFIDISHDTLHKVKFIAKERPDLLNEIDQYNRSIHSVYNQILKEKQRGNNLNNKPLPLPKGKYRTIVIDPPWPTEKIPREIRPNQGEFDYPTLTIEEIMNFPIENIMADECHIYLWTTQKYLPSAFEILKKWGIGYIFTMVWHKTGGFQPFGLPQYNCEFVLFGRKGGLEFLDIRNFFTCFEGKRLKHSKKPEEFYELIERVSLPPRIDIFARAKREGWNSYGNEL